MGWLVVIMVWVQGARIPGYFLGMKKHLIIATAQFHRVANGLSQYALDAVLRRFLRPPTSSPFLGSSGPITQQILHPPPSVTRSQPGSLQEGGSEGSSGSQSPLLGRVGQWSAWSTGSAAERAEEYTDNAPQRRRFTCIAIALLAVVVAAFVLNACLGNGHSSGGSGSIVL